MTDRATATGVLMAVGLLLPLSAHAYLDPGTGSFILQMVIAGALGAMLYIKLAWHQVKAFFGRLMGRPQDDDADAAKTEAGADDDK